VRAVAALVGCGRAVWRDRVACVGVVLLFESCLSPGSLCLGGFRGGREQREGETIGAGGSSIVFRVGLASRCRRSG